MKRKKPEKKESKKKIGGRNPSQKDKTSKIKKLIKLSKSRKKKRK